MKDRSKLNNAFDFSGLYNATEDYMIRHERDKYLRIQLCGTLKNDCNQQPGYAICLYDKGQEFGIGEKFLDFCAEVMSHWSGDV